MELPEWDLESEPPSKTWKPKTDENVDEHTHPETEEEDGWEKTRYERKKRKNSRSPLGSKKKINKISARDPRKVGKFLRDFYYGTITKPSESLLSDESIQLMEDEEDEAIVEAANNLEN